MKKDNNNNHRIVKSIIRISYAVIILFFAQMQDFCNDRWLIAISAMFILVAPVADCIIEWISDKA